ncbi:MAG TPA: hypothetical protein VF611_11365 [Pyrinomonadaceae bacterium]|jgi:hypothetical protein
MFKACTRLRPALLALALSLSAAASGSAQDTPAPEWIEVGRAEARAAARQEAREATPQEVAQTGGARQQPTPDPSPQPTPRTPLTGEQKVKRALRGAFLNPASYAITAFNAGVRQIGEDRLPHKDTEDELADWGSTAARVFATRTTYGFFGNGVYPALFKQDPRYERAPNKGVGRRAAHAVSRLFVTRGDNGKLQPNFSRFAGAATSSAMANIWERSTPGHDRIGPDATLKRFGRSFLSGAIGNLFREFASDIFRR